MKIRNEYIKIKTNKEIVLRNYIYDNYLKLFSKTQYLEEDAFQNTYKKLTYCFIKFDTELEDIQNANITDFDISIASSQNEVIGNKQEVNALYTYTTRRGIRVINTREASNDLNQYAGKKVTALAFGNNEIMACVDTSNYNVYIVQDEEFNVSRKDIITSDAICIGSDYPVHLAPLFKTCEYESAGRTYSADIYAKLYSIGLGATIGKMEEEYIIGKDINVIKESDTSFGFNLRKGNEQSVYPQNDLYSGNSLYPLPLYVQNEVHPQNSLCCSEEQYPLASNYKYVIYKYQLYYIGRGSAIEELQDFYTMNYSTRVKGLFEIVNKIERN